MIRTTVNNTGLLWNNDEKNPPCLARRVYNNNNIAMTFCVAISMFLVKVTAALFPPSKNKISIRVNEGIVANDEYCRTYRWTIPFLQINT